MTWRACRLAWIAWLVGVAAAAAPPPPALTPASYRAELERLLAATEGIERRPQDIPAVARLVPAAWRVEAEGQTFLVQSDSLQRDLRDLARHPDPEAAGTIRAQLRQLRDDVDAFERTPALDSRARQRAMSILSRREFAGVRGPSWYDRLRQQVLTFLVDLLGRLLGASNVSTIGRIVIWGLLILAIVVTGAWVQRTLGRAGTPGTILPAGAPVSAKPWAVWLAEARDAASKREWSDAVRLAYWAGISSLESRQMWPADRARTPREYVRLLPDQHEYRPPLLALTSTFEHVWYGRRAADESTFAGALHLLERLGCASR